jgi:hypothetical protein
MRVPDTATTSSARGTGSRRTKSVWASVSTVARAAVDSANVITDVTANSGVRRNVRRRSGGPGESTRWRERRGRRGALL